MTISVGFFVWELARIRRWEVVEGAMIFHHVVSILIWPVGVSFGLANFFLLSFMASELSSPFIHIRWALLAFTGSSMKFHLATASFALSFILVRVCIAPFSLAAFYAARCWDAELHGIPQFVSILATITLPLPNFLNLFWFWMIIQMGLRAAKPSKPKAKDQ